MRLQFPVPTFSWLVIKATTRTHLWVLHKTHNQLPVLRLTLQLSQTLCWQFGQIWPLLKIQPNSFRQRAQVLSASIPGLMTPASLIRLTSFWSCLQRNKKDVSVSLLTFSSTLPAIFWCCLPSTPIIILLLLQKILVRKWILPENLEKKYMLEITFSPC